MSVYLRKNRYYFRKLIEGRYYHKALGLRRGQEGLLSARLAQVEQETIAQHRGLPRPRSASRVSLYDYAKDTFLKAHEHKRSYADDCSELSIIVGITGDMPLASFGKRDAEKIERTLLERKRTTTTVNRYMALLRHLFNHAIEDGLLHENPIRHYVPYIEETKRRALSAGEIRDVLCAAAAIQDAPASKNQAHIYDIIVVALNTGLRLSEILQLRREHVRDGLILLPYSATKSRRRSATERARVKVIPINTEVRAVIDKAPRGGEYIFDIDNGRGHDSLRRTIKQIRKLSGVAEFGMHYLRHTVSTQLAAHVNIAAAKEMLGHSNLATTLRYTHPGLDEKQSGVAVLENRFREVAGKPLTEHKIRRQRG